MVSLPHPIQYQGSKRKLASDILRFLPKKIERLVEPFAGTAAISLAAAAREICQSFWINDLNNPLIELLELIIENPDNIADFYTEIWQDREDNSVDYYYQVRDNFNKTKDPKLFLYLLARCVKGSVRYNNQGEFNQSPDKRRKGTNPNKMRENIKGVSRLLHGKCIFTSLDYRQVLYELKNTDFVYLDPPYQGVCGNNDSRYYSGICFDTLVLELEELNRKGIAFAISYDGKRGSKTFGDELPKELGLKKIEKTV
ncbi:Dam family site-specific DNA-(adenine-N6)-methyltransferase [Symplocastrum sp. BBK-W-15]|uniref:site-specific DNA-methyltransferase (adenine-specific) n=1 Tax=Limnofasciculus baicalensis BBK-W-15 TaxID=2699891 RepID=A0AAE3GNA3_9CYAN|nr:Dam family site-specific DNA-(adenine-N6)-methyltransferase [Limnofasciculus baicalensis]MCP2727745.1 Dam family site-specific DNA-(adenine-N6)-methyltransferase [Limnofasciculus baicalensis BBK-W-15]